MTSANLGKSHFAWVYMPRCQIWLFGLAVSGFMSSDWHEQVADELLRLQCGQSNVWT